MSNCKSLQWITFLCTFMCVVLGLGFAFTTTVDGQTVTATAQPDKPGLTITPHDSTDVRRAVIREEMGKLTSAYIDGTLVFSNDGEDFAFVVQTGNGQRIVRNGKEQEGTFKQIGRVRFAPVTHKLFYWALDLTGQQIVLVADNKPIKTDFTGEGSLIFSDEGTQWAALRGERNGVTIIRNGKTLGRYKDATWPTFSRPDGKHIAYLIKDTQSRISLVVDGEVKKTFESPKIKASFPFASSVNGPNLPPLFSTDYLSDGLLILTQDKNGWTVYHDDVPLASYPHNIWGGGNSQIITFDGFETAPAILAYSLTYADNAPVAYWWERLEGKAEHWRVVRNGKPVDEKILCTTFWDSQSVALSDDGEHYGYPCISEGKDVPVFVIIDGKKYGLYANVWGVKVSGQGKHFAYAAVEAGKDKSWRYYLDGKAFDLDYDGVWPPQLSRDGAHIMWKARRGEDENEKVYITLDGQEIAEDIKVLWGPAFDEANHAVWIAKDENKIVRFSVNLG